MKKFALILMIFISGFSYTQAQVTAVDATITLTPVKVFIPSTGDYVYLAKNVTGNSYSLFISKDPLLFELFSVKGKDSVINLQGAVFKPLNHYTKKQWKRLSKEIKMFFPAISHEELEKMNFYMIFNYSIVPVNLTVKSSTSKKPLDPDAPVID